jgi:S1-C subfamily serine protease
MAQEPNVLQLSRDATVRIVSQSGNSSGTGFMIENQYLLTCFHVIASLSMQGTSIQWTAHNDVKVTLASGETLSGTLVSIPTNKDGSPLTQDFAVVKLESTPKLPFTKLNLAAESEAFQVGDDVVFSGYPLATPGMVTHRGMISGFDAPKNLIFVQASINKGNSGGALVNSQGHVVGIVSMREGGISKGLSDLTKQIDQTASQGSVRMMGVDSLQATKSIIQTLDQYISTGIGYAINIKFARDYINKSPDLLKK